MKESPTRYIITLTRQQNGFQAIIKQTGKLPRVLNGVRLDETDCITIKNQSISLGDIVSALQNYDEDWLQDWFDECGQWELGCYLYQQLFSTEQAVQNAEICIISHDEHINHLPWVLLANEGIFLTIALGWSVFLSVADELHDCTLPALPRLLIVAPEPENEEPTKAADHLSSLKQMLTNVDTGLTPEIVYTWDDFIRAINENPPDVLYYYGHGISDTYTTRLVFADNNNQRLDKPVTDLISLLKNQPPKLAYFNCCFGDAGGMLGVGKQLSPFIPAVLTNRTIAIIDTAQEQALCFWESTLLDGYSPHRALGKQYQQLGELKLSTGDIRWLTPVLHRSYDQWLACSQEQLKRQYRDPHWRLRLDRRKQISFVNDQTENMLRFNKPKALGFLWYGRSDQGVEIFHQRLFIELQEKLSNTYVYQIRPEWSAAIDEDTMPICFNDMLCQAFKHTGCFDYLGETILRITRAHSFSNTLIYVRHAPVAFDFTDETKFNPDFLQDYLEWWDAHFIRKLPENCHALLGLSYEVEDPERFTKGLVERDLDDVELSSDMVFDLLDELEKITKKDLRNFIKAHNIPLLDAVKNDTYDSILESSKGNYDRVLDELQKIERAGGKISGKRHKSKGW